MKVSEKLAAILEALALAVIIGGIGLALIAFGPETQGGNVVDDPEPVSLHEKLRNNVPLHRTYLGAVALRGGYERLGIVINPRESVVLPSDWTPIVTTHTNPNGACDSDEECAEATDEACDEAGHEGSDEESVEISEDFCTANCSDGSGAVAIIACSWTIIDDPDPAGVRIGGNSDVQPNDN